MIKRTIGLGLLLLGIFLIPACKKGGSFPDIPELKFKTIAPQELTAADDVVITCDFRSRRNIQNYYVRFQPVNFTHPPANTPPFDSTFTVPQFPGEGGSEGDMLLILKPGIDFVSPTGAAEDSFYFRVFIQSLDQSISSDTIETSAVLIKGS